jgi:hypothetical protein
LGWALFVQWFLQRPAHVWDNNVSDQQYKVWLCRTFNLWNILNVRSQELTSRWTIQTCFWKKIRTWIWGETRLP